MILCLFTFLSCSKNYDAEVCDDLAMKKYRGQPFESNEYDKNCMGKIQHKITTQMCQSALESLITEGKEEILKQKFGPKIMSCFTGDDLKKYLK